MPDSTYSGKPLIADCITTPEKFITIPSSTAGIPGINTGVRFLNIDNDEICSGNSFSINIKYPRTQTTLTACDITVAIGIQ
ncbi:MAG: hypothetical protein IKU47_07295 [Oscillospiraceae bacterium]|nr:hypothetical protein [Oscillospiraceae bacterium]